MFPVATPEEITEQTRPYQPFGAARQLLFSRQPQIVISGPAGTGKSRACLEKIHCCCQQVPGCRWLICRKTRVSLTESGLVTWETKVVQPDHPILQNGPTRAHRASYEYPNGAAVVLGGLDNPTRLFSTEYDGVYVQEAIELDENEWELLTRPLRNNKLPYQQLIGDTNPGAPSHWIKQRANRGQTVLLESRHQDNPELWQIGEEEWTAAGRRYIGILDALTGPRKQRLRYGKWVQAEGVVYENYDPAVHVVDRFPIPKDWPRYWAIDFGYTNPFVCQWWAEDPDGRLFLYREIFMSQRLVEDHARTILAVSGALTDGRATWLPSLAEPQPQAIICDHDRQERETLHKYLAMETEPAFKDVIPGVQAVTERLAKAGDGRPRLFILRDSLVERDWRLTEQKKPASTAEEFEGYIWDETAQKKKGEKPSDLDNHGMDALRYMVYYRDRFTHDLGQEPFVFHRRY